MEQKDPTPLQDETITEEKNIEKQEEAPVSSNDKKTNKVKKPVTRKRTMITSIIISVISCLVGGFGGYVLYSGLNPEEDPIVIEKDSQRPSNLAKFDGRWRHGASTMKKNI